MFNYRKSLSDVVHKSSKKKSLIFFCFALFLLINPIYLSAQDGKVSISVNNVTLKQFFDTIEKQSKYKFSYRDSALQGKDNISINAENKSLKDILNEILQARGLKYTTDGTNIVIIPSDAQETTKKEISGLVTDTTGEPIIGANIIEKGTSNGTITDMNGYYSLEVNGNTLTISYIGYISQDISIGNKTNINVQLAEDTQKIDEVVVVGYGTQKKVNLTGSVETIKADVIENRPLRNATDALQGTIPGLTVTSTAGQPGNSSDFTVRGKSSINSGSALVLIDGMPGDINTINPLDIESISVLKDAASSAIYGARAAEGVILITTKQGNSPKVKVDYSGNISFNTPTRIPQSNNSWDHAQLSNTAFNNAGLAVQFPEEALNAIKNHTTTSIPNGNDWIYTADVDWIGMMMDHSFQQNHNISVSKSDDRLKYLFSFGWLDQDGLFAEYGPDNYDRFNVRSNVNLDIIKDKLNFDSRITFNNTNKRYHPSFDYSYAGEEDAYNPLTSGWTIPYITFIQAGPNMPIYDTNGNYARYRMQANPIQALREGGLGQNKGNNIEGIFTLTLTPIKDLSVKAVGGIRYKNEQIKDWRAEYGKYGPDGLRSMAAGQTGPNRIIQKTRNTRYMTGQLIAEYKKTIRKNEMSVLGGWSTEQNRYDQLRAERINIVGNSLPALSLGATEGWSNGAIEEEWALLSGFMRVNYAFASKYLAEFNFRADASSRFSKKHQWGFFPSASIGWRITEEEFMKEQSIFTNLKIRASWGRLGNQNGLGLYDHMPQYTVGGYYPFQNELAQWAIMKKLPSETRTWETVEMENIAVDMGFLDNRLNVTGEYFIKKNKDMLVNVELPSVIGIDLPTSNFGSLKVNGWEVSVSWRDKIKDFTYGVQFNLSDQIDKLTDYGVEYNGFTAGVNQKIQGYSLGSIFGYETDGYFTSQEDVDKSAVINRSVVGVGDIKYIDQDGDGKISAPNDLKYLGTTTPRFVFGLNLNASWKDFDLSLLFQGVGKRNFYLNRQAVAPFYDTFGNYSYTFHNDYWTPENPNAALPRHYAGSGHNYETSDHWLQNAAYIRLKNLQFGYTLPVNLTQKFYVNRLRVYFSGENLFEFSKLQKDYDPELTNIGGFMYPIMRNYSIGLNVTF